MFNTAAKLYFGLTTLALVLAVGYEVVSGDRSGTWIFIFLTAAALLSALVATGSGIKDRVTVPAGDEAEAGPASFALDRSLQPRPSPWPLLLALAVGVFAVGAAVGHVLIVLGLVAMLLAVAGGFAQAFREDPSHTPVAGYRAADRAIAPVLLPLGAFTLIAVVVLSVSRVLLAVPKAASVGIAFGLAMFLLLGFAFIAARPRATSRVLAGVAALALVSVMAAGAVGAGSGERAFEKHVPPPTIISVMAKNTQYNTSTVTVPLNQKVTIRFLNEDRGIYHNVGVWTAPSGGTPIVDGQPVKGIGRRDYQWSFTTPGQFNFRCDFHPNMVGTLVVSATASGTAP